MSSAPYVLYEPRSSLATVQWIECQTKDIAEIRKSEKSVAKIFNKQKKSGIWRGKKE